MSAFAAAVLRVFMPLALVAGALLASPGARKSRKAPRRLAGGAAAGATAAVAAHLLAGRAHHLTAARVGVASAVVAAAALYAGFFLSPRGRAFRKAHSIAAVAFLAMLAASCAFSFLDLIGALGLSSADVLNTDLLLNAGGLWAGGLLTALLVPLTARLAARSPGLRVGFLLAASTLLLLLRCADVLLGLMRLEVLETAAWRVSLVARADRLAAALPYIEILMLAGLAAAFYRRRAVFTGAALSDLGGPQRRKAVGATRSDARWCRAAAAACAALLLLLSYDVYASRPPRLSRAVPLKADADGFLRVRIDQVDEGSLHRFSFTTRDGLTVRFFMIRRTGERAGRGAIGVVYDACMMCGDKGYLQMKDGVHCAACNVRIHLPSIGKAGGCNPIPLDHRVEGDAIVIDPSDLAKGAGHFTQAAKGG